MAAADDSSPSTACKIIFFLWSLGALLAAIAALLLAFQDMSSKATPWMIFSGIAILVADRYRR